jgi:hypothetical protein
MTIFFSKIANLQLLNLSMNKDLHLEYVDVDTLAALPHLRKFKLRKESEEIVWTCRDLNVVYAVSKRLPQLDMRF